MNNTNTSLVNSELYDYFILPNILGAKNDLDIIQSWLQRCGSNSKNTYDSYLREIKRFSIFCSSIGKHYTDVSAKEINEYLGILKNPPPNWLKDPDSVISVSTQLLYKPLSLRSIEYAQGILRNFFSYIQDAGVINSNPVRLSIKIKSDKGFNIDGKSLSFDAWDYLSSWLKYESENKVGANRSKSIRDRWLMHLLYHSGARRSSIVGLNMNAFKIKNKGTHRSWVLEFIQKGNNKHEIIVNPELLSELEFYRKCLGLSKYPTKDESNIYMVATVGKVKANDNKIKLNSDSSISLRGINYVIKQSLELAAADCEDYFISEELKKATTHTFRHTIATHRLNMGGDIVSTQRHLGHKSLNTTMIYAKESGKHELEESKKIYDKMMERKNLKK
jgi:site-specific recombinase XerD